MTPEKLSDAEIETRREALRAAERSGMMEGLPPASEFAREQGELYAQGKITADDAVAAIIQYYLSYQEDPKHSK